MSEAIFNVSALMALACLFGWATYLIILDYADGVLITASSALGMALYVTYSAPAVTSTTVAALVAVCALFAHMQRVANRTLSGRVAPPQEELVGVV